MQPVVSKQSSLRCPLNEVLGSQGHVRLLRVLATHPEGPLRPSEAAEKAGLTESGARRALLRLSRTGLVQRTWNGRENLFCLCREGALGREVARLFEVEQTRGDALLGAIRGTLRDMPDAPELAWLQGLGEGETDCQEIGVLGGESGNPEWVAELKERLVQVEEEFEVVLEVLPYTGASLESVPWEEVAVLNGTLPGNGSRPSGNGARSVAEEPAQNPFREDGRLNPKSPEFAGALAALLEENLSVLRRARENVRGRLREGANGDGPELWEWQKILDTFSLPRLIHFLGSDSPRAVRLRQCSPFPAVLSEEEKTRLSELAFRPH